MHVGIVQLFAIDTTVASSAAQLVPRTAAAAPAVQPVPRIAIVVCQQCSIS